MCTYFDIFPHMQKYCPDIAQVSDGIMVARGDLAVEIPMESLANVQKEIVRRCNRAGATRNRNY